MSDQQTSTPRWEGEEHGDTFLRLSEGEIHAELHLDAGCDWRWYVGRTVLEYCEEGSTTIDSGYEDSKEEAKAAAIEVFNAAVAAERERERQAEFNILAGRALAGTPLPDDVEPGAITRELEALRQQVEKDRAVIEAVASYLQASDAFDEADNRLDNSIAQYEDDAVEPNALIKANSEWGEAIAQRKVARVALNTLLSSTGYPPKEEA